MGEDALTVEQWKASHLARYEAMLDDNRTTRQGGQQVTIDWRGFVRRAKDLPVSRQPMSMAVATRHLPPLL